MSTHNYSPAIIAQTTIQMLTSALSAICSTMLAVMILRSNSNRSSSAASNGGTGSNRLNTPYKRYLLGMCVIMTTLETNKSHPFWWKETLLH
jgi:hypothetical protein